MTRWSWQQSPGKIRTAVLLGIAAVATLGVMYFTFLSHSVILSNNSESQPHSHGLSQAQAATPHSRIPPLLHCSHQNNRRPFLPVIVTSYVPFLA